MKDILSKKSTKRLLAALALVTVFALVLSGCATQTTQKPMPISHNSSNWWDAWVVYYLSQFVLWIAKVCGGSYGWAIIIFTVIIRVILLPLNAVQINSTRKMQEIQPELKALQEKYSSKDLETRNKLNEETQKLYKEAGVNPYAGCLPMVIQLPVMWALYQAIWRTPEMQNGKFLWMDLGKPDPYYILPILATVFTFLSSYIATLSVPKSSQTTMTKMMSYVMAIMVGIWAIVFQSAISLYWVISNLFQVGQTLVLQNPFKYRKEQEAKEEAERERQRKMRRAYKRIKRK
ncbi:membrane protein insertase YidC [Lactobacillus delbrueckii subsp. lactis]|uniref:YidC/Oxa1 family membrane protein insertase n=1 Tax=Lactobacillus delbrueckii TaxID=1584 RepID=UPI000202D55D|nr:membrane protein insertase YidC [Lactobacillus delbrueckii]APG70212.1 OxaA precursor [Lactobacillus delbrueckii subsp. lactis]ASW12671.1 protein translocase component YidC [Lactobacillus delbrueckii subsp. lactis DSM 20072]ASW64799.1 protein translocase component YidC [Lactobacillus delbrueckii subsp. lactis]EGD27241.1 ParB/SpoJ family partitioning protein [Lactobacillus delbrueckii subsp. lactis DSM 20072]KRK66475.1 parb spoj family partitioning protein [Lactobacillus delbrueckii subsp. la